MTANNPLVYATGYETDRARREKAAPFLAIHAAAQRAAQRPPVAGQCLSCGSIEVTLTRVVGFRDFSSIGESSRYPVGDGCEACS